MVNIRKLFAENVLLTASDFITGGMTRQQLKFLLKSQYWPKTDIDEYQNVQLRKLIRHCYHNVPFYRDVMKQKRLTPSDIRTKSDLVKMPIITKDDLRKAGSKTQATNIAKGRLYYQASSGSTGEPFRYSTVKTAESFLKASAIRAWYWHGYRLGDRYVKISMNPRSSFIKKLQDGVNNCNYLSAQQLSEADFMKIIDGILGFDPIIIRGYPVPLFFLSELMHAKVGEYSGKSLKGINTTGSTLYPDVKQKIESSFNSKIFDSYSCEGGSNFSQCDICGLYHPTEEYAISEYVSDSYTLNDPDKPKRHITTDLVNYASPFIRYDSQDYLVVRDNEPRLNCARPYDQIEKIKGRESDILKTPGGKYLIVENFVAYFEYVPEVDIFQVIQSQLNKIDINVVVNSGFNDSILGRIYDYWREYIGNDVEVHINVVDELTLTPTGKRRTVVRDSKIKLEEI